MAVPLLLLLLLGGGAVAVAGAKKPKAKSKKAKSKKAAAGDYGSIADLPGPATLDAFSRARLLITGTPSLKNRMSVLAATHLKNVDGYDTETIKEDEAVGLLAKEAWNHLRVGVVNSGGRMKIAPDMDINEYFKRVRGIETPQGFLFYCLLVGATSAFEEHTSKHLSPESTMWKFGIKAYNAPKKCDWNKLHNLLKPANKNAISSEAKLKDFYFGLIHSNLDFNIFNAINRAQEMMVEKGAPSSIKNRRWVPSDALKKNAALWIDDSSGHDSPQWELNLTMTFSELVNYYLIVDIFAGECQWAYDAISGFTRNFMYPATAYSPEIQVEGYVTAEELGVSTHGVETFRWKDVRFDHDWWEVSGKGHAEDFLKQGHDIEETAIRLLTSRYEGEESLAYDWRLYAEYPTYKKYFEDHPEAGYDSYTKAVDDFNAEYPMIYGAMNAIMNQIASEFDLKEEGIAWP